jgi:hypothetical protein
VEILRDTEPHFLPAYSNAGSDWIDLLRDSRHDSRGGCPPTKLSQISQDYLASRALKSRAIRLTPL